MTIAAVIEWFESYLSDLNPSTKFQQACRIAIAALREKMEREKGCEHCRGEFAALNKTMEYSGLEFARMKNILRVRYYPSHKYDTFQTQDFINIKFCPMCGRRLEENAK